MDGVWRSGDAVSGFDLLSAVGSFFTSTLGSSPLQWGLGIAMAAFDHTPFGWLSWGLNWLGDGVLFNHSDYYSHSTTVADWGLPRGRMFAYAGRGGFGERGGGYERGGYGSGRGIARPLEGGNRFAETPNRGYSAANQGYRQGSMEAYNRTPAPISRPQSYSRPESRLAYGPEAYGSSARTYGGAEAYRGPAAQMYRAPTQAYRGPGESFQGGGRSSESFREPKYQEPKSGGFHLFGGGNKEPKMSAGNSFRGNRGFSGFGESRSFGGGKPPKMSSPKSFGGGGHSSFGGHSSGGHSSGRSSSGHHR